MGSSICSRNKTLFFRVCIGGLRSKKRVFLLSHDSENLRNFDCHDTQWASQYTWGKKYYNNEIKTWYLFSRCKHRWHVTSEEIQKAKKHVTEINDLHHKIAKTDKQTKEMKYILLFHLSSFRFLFRSLASFVVGKFIRAQVFEQSLENTTKTRVGLKIIVQAVLMTRHATHISRVVSLLPVLWDYKQGFNA